MEEEFFWDAQFMKNVFILYSGRNAMFSLSETKNGRNKEITKTT